VSVFSGPAKAGSQAQKFLLAWMKIANPDKDLTTSHVLVERVKQAPTNNRPADQASTKFLKGSLVGTDGKSFATGTTLSTLLEQNI